METVPTWAWPVRGYEPLYEMYDRKKNNFLFIYIYINATR